MIRVPPIPMPLPGADYQTMNCSANDFSRKLSSLPEETQYYVVNATHRLAEVDWITRRLEEDISTSGPPVVQEGLLSLQMYLLLTCADALGHIRVAGGVGARFRKFFSNLPPEAKRNLIDNIYTWRTDLAELVNLGLRDTSTNIPFYPSHQQIVQFIQLLNLDKRLENIVEFLYKRRNFYTHESKCPQLGLHPNLSVMQNQRLGMLGTATFGERDRLQPICSGNDIYFTYYETDDVIATIRWSIVRGLGQEIGFV